MVVGDGSRTLRSKTSAGPPGLDRLSVDDHRVAGGLPERSGIGTATGIGTGLRRLTHRFELLYSRLMSQAGHRRVVLRWVRRAEPPPAAVRIRVPLWSTSPDPTRPDRYRPSAAVAPTRTDRSVRFPAESRHDRPVVSGRGTQRNPSDRRRDRSRRRSTGGTSGPPSSGSPSRRGTRGNRKRRRIHTSKTGSGKRTRFRHVQPRRRERETAVTSSTVSGGSVTVVDYSVRRWVPVAGALESRW